MKYKKHFNNIRVQRIGALLVVVTAGAIGVYLLGSIKAASPYVAVQASTGTLSGGATIFGDANASGGNAVKFTQPAAPGTWQDISPAQISADPNNPVNNFGYQTVALDPTNQSTVFIGTNYQGLWKSTNSGSTWAKINTGSGGTLLDSGRLWALAIDPFNHNTIWTTAGYGAGGPLKSTDGGVTWTQLTGLQTTITTNDIYSINLDPYTANHVIIAFHYFWNGNQDSGVAESTDGGTTWTLHYPPAGSGWGAGNAVWFLNNTKTWLLGSQGSGIWRTTDSGANWTQVSTEPITHGGIESLVRDPGSGDFYLAHSTDISKSTDNGATWTNITTGLTFSYYESVIDDGVNLYTAPSFPTLGNNVNGPWYFRPLSGGTWQPYNSQHTCESRNSLCNGPFAGAHDSVNHVIYSPDGVGGLWKLIGN